MSSNTASPTMDGIPASPAVPETISTRRLIAFLIMVFGMFMSILDIQIVSASLSDIQAGLSASSSEVSWVQTAYLIAEVIAIPLSGFLSRALGTRLLFAISAAGFTAASFMCGLTSTIEQMILWRAVQGFLGAGMIPTVFASAYTIFPRSKMPMVTPIIGLVATLAPTVGPTVGGYITDVMSWHWLFFINIVPGIGITIGVWMLVDFDKPNFKLLEKFDWWGLASMAGFLGALEYVLEEGPQYDWFQDPSVFWLGIVCAFSAFVFFWRVLRVKEPIVDIRAFTDRNFALGSMFSFCVGIGLYGLTYIYPRYLAEVRGYSALMIGETMFVSGIAMFATAPLVGKLMTKVDLRYLIAAGLIIFAIGSWQMTWITRDYDFYELLWPQVFRGVGMMLAMVPVNNIALGTLPPDRLKNASGLFNLTRNLGGAVGLAIINTVLDHRTDLHISRLHDRVTWGNAMAVETLNMLTQKFQGAGNASLMAMKQLSQIVHRQAVVMSFGDAFFMLTCFYLVLSTLVFFVRKPNVMGPPPDAH
ncbi:MAG: DHA2 family efflux MFS transporter permease subunit [Bradyrhizobiaceae bacterium]|uniref:Drug:H+ antiporter-2 (14 Spanner) (DHA2) family drug resistance MFS transporter n=2 Tax=Pseudomonadota TaxID=1224 RepID=K8P1Z4_9BRAD|nr:MULTISPECIES: DHA2 family efflux MFS transporter permease subunit [Afipia]MAH68898.1 MFS transporter [Afipia sp.]OUX61870.1 MAG: MFS transporter [Afipia sp. TMED4]RTL78840.1 MAG: DHA2 family efflux MFS transporter permease subunit [Bradyrhizobiaceae bacterium]EKS36612.1 drug:H+ antiporter-2 (14 Spanner) (DHA2) family drug resistance MFS transporter [Afipia broomeae ATCC 49717]HAO44055.1 MFS transporter [Afipia sp.]